MANILTELSPLLSSYRGGTALVAEVVTNKTRGVARLCKGTTVSLTNPARDSIVPDDATIVVIAPGGVSAALTGSYYLYDVDMNITTVPDIVVV